MLHVTVLKLTAVVVCFFLFSPSVIGSEEEHDAEEARHRHALGVFVGVTRAESENLETLGIEYAYRFHRNWSAAAVVERADREKDSTLVVAAINLHPYKGWFLSGGVGRKDPGGERENTVRVAIGYEFELAGGWAIAPNVSKDFIENEEDEEVFGVTFYKLF